MLAYYCAIHLSNQAGSGLELACPLAGQLSPVAPRPCAAQFLDSAMSPTADGARKIR
jgi:hypothetical protein